MTKASGVWATLLLVSCLTACGGNTGGTAAADEAARKFVAFMDKHRDVILKDKFDSQAFTTEGKPLAVELGKLRDQETGKFTLGDAALKDWKRAFDDFQKALVQKNNYVAAAALADLCSVFLAAEDPLKPIVKAYQKSMEEYEASRVEHEKVLESNSTRRTWFWIVIGICAAAVVVGIILLASSGGGDAGRVGVGLVIAAIGLGGLVAWWIWPGEQPVPPEKPEKPGLVTQAETVLELETTATKLKEKAAEAVSTAAGFRDELVVYRVKLGARMQELGVNDAKALEKDLRGNTLIDAVRDLFAKIDGLEDHSRRLKDMGFTCEERARGLRRRMAAEKAGLSKNELAEVTVELDQAKKELRIESASFDFLDKNNEPILQWIRTGKR